MKVYGILLQIRVLDEKHLRTGRCDALKNQRKSVCYYLNSLSQKIREYIVERELIQDTFHTHAQ